MPRRRPKTPQERRDVVAKVVEIVIKAVMGNHVYTFAGKLYKQTKGGAIGLRLTGILARIRMDRWYRRMTLMIDDQVMRVFLMVKFVDDINLVMSSLGLGARWNNKSLQWSKEWEKEDRIKGKLEDTVTMCTFQAMANSMEPDLVFTVDMCDDHLDGKVPMLDLAVWG